MSEKGSIPGLVRGEDLKHLEVNIAERSVLYPLPMLTEEKELRRELVFGNPCILEAVMGGKENG